MKVEDILTMAQGLNCDYEIGIWSEANSFFKNREEIDVYETHYEKNKQLYDIAVKLKKYNLYEVKEVFASFVRFIEYAYFTFYIRTDFEHQIEYVLLSAMKSGKGILIKIKFS
ncbi:hypothetical protein HQN90_00705 [Paenibacillus alba]|uniref:hypothetical protein n=1 Tax=Paenibacillus alba TaxID=1197127 RepID=UPI001567B034|nr:hypothetical protein [Paenibacillus alba]NQX64635.1 hypothetical protein [Paenibacillus alba]